MVTCRRTGSGMVVSGGARRLTEAGCAVVGASRHSVPRVSTDSIAARVTIFGPAGGRTNQEVSFGARLRTYGRGSYIGAHHRIQAQAVLAPAGERAPPHCKCDWSR